MDRRAALMRNELDRIDGELRVLQRQVIEGNICAVLIGFVLGCVFMAWWAA